MYRNYHRNYASYNYGRSRYGPYSYYDSYWYDWLREYYYGRSRRTRRGGRRNDDTAEAPKEELVKVLNVQDVNLHIQSNTLMHRTDLYECTEERKSENGEDLPAKLVLRRGEFFDVTITFDRPYDNEKHDMRLSFSYGDDPMVTRGTLVEFKLDESGKQTFKADEWGANLISKSGNSIKAKIHVPANCLVGEWELTVKSYSKGKDKDGKETVLSFSYEDDQDIIILFNAWCKADPCYMATEKLLQEYVLNDSGVVYQGGGWSINGKGWEFGQFEDEVLEAALHIMKSAFNRPDSLAVADPVKVVRGIAMMVNSSRGGVLQGNWSGNYEGGTKPWIWKSSVPILKQFMKNKKPVKFGQCWVFSAVTTTVCRTLGIPCRSVTNFQSAHDTEESNTIDKFFDKDGNDVTKNFTGDSVWNFHVWNEVWLARADLVDKSGMGGWQVIDATPQEESFGAGDMFSGNYTCGPCPVHTIKVGNCTVNFDAGFIFSEVNADVIHWQITEDGKLSVLKVRERDVGKNISTKKPDGKPYPPEDYDPVRDRYRDLTRESRLDITHEYKYPEGSEEEREAVLMAHKTARHPVAGAYDAPKYKKDVKLKLIHDNDLMIGSDLKVKVKAKNRSEEDRVLEKVVFKIYPKTYTGFVGKPLFQKQFDNIKLAAGQEESVSVIVTQSDYLTHLVEVPSLSIEVYTVVKNPANEEKQRSIKNHDFTFATPGLKIEGPKRAKFGEEVTYKVTFTNPVNVPLTNCRLKGESTAFKKETEEPVPDVPANGEMTHKLSFKVKNKLKKSQHAIAFTLDTDELHDITDGLTAAFSA